MADGCPGIAVGMKSKPRFLDENDVYCLVCKVKEGMDNICPYCCIVFDKAFGLVGAV